MEAEKLSVSKALNFTGWVSDHVFGCPGNTEISHPVRGGQGVTRKKERAADQFPRDDGVSQVTSDMTENMKYIQCGLID